MVASAKISSSILVVRVSHGTMVYVEIILAFDPATIAAMAVVVFITYFSVFEFAFVIVATC